MVMIPKWPQLGNSLNVPFSETMIPRMNPTRLSG